MQEQIIFSLTITVSKSPSQVLSFFFVFLAKADPESSVYKTH